MEILRRYYGEDIEIVRNAPMRGYAPSYGGTPLRRGSRGPQVVQLQVMLNRIGQNYPAIPRVASVDGIFGTQTENAVLAAQRIFNLDPDGIVGKGTWYQLVRLYVAVTELSELASQGQTFYAVNWRIPAYCARAAPVSRCACCSICCRSSARISTTSPCRRRPASSAS